MSVEEIRNSLLALAADERREVTAFLFQLRHASDAEYQARIDAVISDKDPDHWLTPDEFEKRLDAWPTPKSSAL